MVYNIEMLLSATRRTGECCEWVGYCNDDGYGRRKINGVTWLIHRLMWTLVNGKIPKGKLILHSCDNPPCINPEHLFVGTSKDNTTDCITKGRFPNLKGESNPAAKLTLGQVSALKQDTRSLRAIARDYGISYTHVSNIKLGRAW